MKITKTDLKCGSQFFFISSHGKVVDPWRTKPLQIADLAWQVTSASFGAITCLLNSTREICRLLYEIMIDKQTLTRSDILCSFLSDMYITPSPDNNTNWVNSFSFDFLFLKYLFFLGHEQVKTCWPRKE